MRDVHEDKQFARQLQIQMLKALLLGTPVAGMPRFSICTANDIGEPDRWASVDEVIEWHNKSFDSNLTRDDFW
jgi:hypothetical protein